MTIDLTRRVMLGGLVALPACQSSKNRFDAEVIILGAGLSGLHAARLLAEEGKDVLVLEASNRIGGRLHTLRHGASAYTEGGGEQIGANYARIIDTAQSLNIELIPDTNTRPETAYFYQGKLQSPSQWKSSDGDLFKAPFTGSAPALPLFSLAAKENPLTSSEDWRSLEFEDYDISADAFLTQHGFSPEARRVIEVSLNGNNLASYSMMNLYRTLQLFSQSRGMGRSSSIKGGAQRLPEAMAASLPRLPLLNVSVTHIQNETDYVSIQTSKQRTFRAPHVICTIPFGALRNIGIKAPQQNAINALPYTQIFQVHFKTETPFWEIDQLPANMWTDSPIERIFADRDATGNLTGYFRAWVNGDGAKTLLSQSKENVSRIFLDTLENIRPSTRNNIEILHFQNWTQKNSLAGGAYMHWAPGQIKQWAGTMSRPHGRIHFAGEHLSYLHTGMEGAMESAENAAFSLLDT